MLSTSEMRSLVYSCTYKPGWIIKLKGQDTERPYIQIEVTAATEASLCSTARDGTREPWRSGKRYLSRHMCRQEVVGAVFALIKDAEMHEVHEWFRYRGFCIYNPHLDPDALVEVAKHARNFNTRQNAMSMEEPS